MDANTSSDNNGTEVNAKSDQAFKTIVKDRDILVALLKGVVPEFKELDESKIIKCLSLESDGMTVIGRNVESPSVYNGPIFLDSAFDVKSPVEGELNLIVAIEAQGRSMSERDLHNREEYYSSRLVSDQGMLFKTKKELYANLRKTIVIWVRLASGANKNTIVRDYRVREFSNAPGIVCPSPLDRADIYEVNVGEYRDVVTEPIFSILNTLFTSEIQGAAKADELKNNYNIDVSGTAIAEADHLGALAEEIQMAREEGLEQGREQGREEGSEKKVSELVEFYTEYVAKKISETGKTAEEIMSDLPILPECYDRILENLGKK